MNIVTRPSASPVPPDTTSADPGLVQQPVEAGRFTVGSTLRHVLVMTAAGSVGLISVFFVDLLSLLYVSRLGDTALTAAVGYASQVLFLLISVNIGLSIAIGALVSRALGAGDRARARHLAASGLVHVAVISGTLSLMIWPFSHDILQFFGARGEALEVGATYLRMTLPASVFLGIGMAFAGILRAVGDAKRAMYVTLGGAIVTACLDPIFIFGFHLGIYGAAIVLVLSRFVLLLVGWHGAGRVHNLVGRLRLRGAMLDFAPLMTIAVPAILTNLATPVANIYAMRIFSQFGQETVAAFAIMDRVTPVAFGVLFALSGSVGPIMGQCFGAGLMDRVRRVFTECLAVAIVYVVLVSGVLWLAAPLIVALFGATGETAALLRFFCTFGGGLWLFLGGIFVANAAYNNLGAPFMSALFNWGRATLGTIPFVTIGAARFGPEGGFVGMIAGAALFGGLAVVGGYVVIARLENRMGGRDVTETGTPLNA
jgi:putative MATE family efflux protein